MSERYPRTVPVYRRVTAAVAAVAFSFGTVSCAETAPSPESTQADSCVYHDDGEHITISLEEVRHCLGSLAVRDKAPKTGYTREQFGSWRTKDGCTTRETILIRDLTDEVVDPGNCSIISGTFDDHYTAENEGEHVTKTSVSDIQIDHVVALSDAWQSGAGAKDYSKDRRRSLANDPLNLQATSGANNRDKSDKDAFDWLPPHASRGELCNYDTEQVLVKYKYSLSVRPEEHKQMEQVFDDDCSKDQLIVIPN